MKSRLIAMAFIALHLAAQGSSRPAPRFEAASVKVVTPPIGGPGTSQAPTCVNGRFTTRYSVVRTLVLWAWIDQLYLDSNHSGEFSGWPAWAQEVQYQVEAKSGSPISEGQCKLMVRQLLAERFKLTLHTVPKTVPVYELIVGRTPPKLHLVADETELAVPEDRVLWNGRGVLAPHGMTMAEFAALLYNNPAVGRPVEDRTGLKGTYGFNLNFSPPGADNQEYPDIFGALRNLGLQLVPAKGTIDFFVIDHLEKPTAN
jgi:uncharacterized protein (TIGR03435 family)